MSLFTAALSASMRHYVRRSMMGPPPATTPPLLALSTGPSAITPAESLLERSIWFLKRTFQPSIIRKKRKTGFLVRQRTVGGRRTLARRQAKGRWRLGGGI